MIVVEFVVIVLVDRLIFGGMISTGRVADWGIWAINRYRRRQTTPFISIPNPNGHSPITFIKTESNSDHLPRSSHPS